MTTDTTKQFLAQLKAMGIELYLDGQQLKSRAEKGKITPEIGAKIRDSKLAIIACLQALPSTTVQKAETLTNRDAASIPSSSTPIAMVPPIQPRPMGVDAPCLASFQQQQLWIIDRLNNGSAEYNISVSFTLNGQVDWLLLQQAVSCIVERHHILRTVYSEIDEALYQHILPANCVKSQLKVSHVLLSAELTTEQIEEETAQLVAQERQRLFDLSTDILCRVNFYEQALVAAQSSNPATQQGVLQLTFHHIAVDGISLPYFLAELAQHYQLLQQDKLGKQGRALNQSAVTELPELSLQYADYAHWQRDQFASLTNNASLNYWQEQLDQLPALHKLRTRGNRPQIKQTQASLFEGELPAETAQRLQLVCQQHGLSPFMLAHGALSLVLAKHSNESDVVIGTPFANRQQAAVEKLIGYFVNTVVLRMQTNQATLGEFFEQLKHTHLMALQHSQIPFETLVDALQVPREVSFNPLFQIMLTVNSNFSASATTQEVALPDFTLTPFHDKLRGSKFDLEVDVTLNNQCVALKWLYDDALFSREDIERLNEHVSNLLCYFAQTDDLGLKPIAGLPILNDVEQSNLLTQWQGERVATSDAVALHHQIEQQAQLTPNAIAIRQADKVCTYAELNALANQIAHWLRAQASFSAGSLVGVCLPRSIDAIISIVGIVKAGCAYLPLDPEYPLLRLSNMIEDAQSSLVITDTQLMAHLWASSEPALIERLLCIDDPIIRHTVQQHSTRNLHLADSAYGDVYSIFTSGSTGRPKPSIIEHHHAINLNDWYAETYGFCGHDSTLLISALGFDLTQKNIWTTLRTGGQLVLPNAGPLNVHHLQEIIAKQQITSLNCTPSVFYILIEHPQLWAQLESLRNVFLGGEPVAPEKLKPWFESEYCCADIINMYGPTECTDITTVYCYQGNENVLPIGRPIRNVEAFVVDKVGELAPFGVEGELVIGGEGVTRGYFGQPELSEEKFIQHRFSDGKQRRLYRTGDIVRWQKDHHSDAQLVFVGRKDFQVKVRGLRIELHEIEQQCESLDCVDQSMVLKHDEQTLKLIVVLAEHALSHDTADVEQLIRDTLTQSLPNYMIPTWIMVLEQWPLTPNGKVDKRALEALAPASTSDINLPKTSTEKQLAVIWCDVLGGDIDALDINQSFFQCGGHSLQLIQLMSRVNHTFSVVPRPQLVFGKPTIHHIATLIDDCSESDRVIIPRRENPQALAPLSPSQRRLWFLDRMQGSSAEYNMPFAFMLEGEIAASIIETTIQQIISRHEVLRSIYVENHGEAFQQVLENWHFTLQQIDLSEQSNAQETAKTMLAEAAEQPFDLSTDLMLRASLYQLSTNSAVLNITLHHIACDGWSIEIIQKEFFEIYQQLLSGSTPKLATLPVQYADYTSWLLQEKLTVQKASTDENTLGTILQYWQQQLCELPVVHRIPLDKPRPDVKLFAGDSVIHPLPQEVTVGIEQLAARLDMTPFMLCHAALSIIVARHSYSSDIVIGTPHANRDINDLSELVGFFVNTLVLRTHVTASSLVDYLEQVKSVNLAAQRHADVPFDELVEVLKLPRDSAHTPAFQILLTTSNDYGVVEKDNTRQFASELTIKAFGAVKPQAKFDLSVDIQLGARDCQIDTIYDVSIFEPATISQFNQQLVSLLTSIAALANCNDLTSVQLSDINMLSEQEQQAINALSTSPLNKASHSKHSTDDNRLVHERFEAQVAKTPDAVAIVFNAQQLNYRTLNAKANQLAHYLREQVATKLKGQDAERADWQIAMCLPRSVEQVIALLAIIKAGAAYVPFDISQGETVVSQRIAQQALRCVLTDNETQARLALPNQCLSLNISEFFTHKAADYSSENLALPLNESTLLYGLSTSGTSGKPKLIGVPHRMGCNLIDGLSAKYAAINQAHKVLQHASISFDLSFADIFTALFYGGSVHLISEHQKYDVAALVRLIAQQEISVLNLSNSLLRALVSEANQLDVMHPSVQVVYSTAEPLQVTDALRQYFIRHPQARLLNCYGPTETHVCTMLLLDQSPETWPDSPSIGQPILHTQSVLIAVDGSIAPQNREGELAISGDCLANGYLNNPTQTNEKFFTATYTSAKNQRWYKTGDIAIWDIENGQPALWCKGRIDDQVKVRGYRVSYSAIEATVDSLSAVKRCVVLTHNDTLTLYVELINEHQHLTDQSLIDNLKAELTSHLPVYMIPTAIGRVNEWPLTVNGKIDKRALYSLPTIKQVEQFIAPQTATEQTMANIWAALLWCEGESISRDANFFNLGGHSLLVVRMIAEIREQCRVELSVKQVFESPVLSVLSQQLDAFLINQQMHEAPSEDLGEEEWL